MKLRRWCKRLLLGALGAGSTVLIAACYGPQSGMSDSYELASGRVANGQGAGVADLQICARFDQAASACTRTGADGSYFVEGTQVDWQEAQAKGFDLLVEDTNGTTGGAWAAKNVTVPSGTQLPVAMDLTVTPLVQ